MRTPQALEDMLHSQRRRAMVDEQLAGRDITDPHVLRAMDRVPRHCFVPTHLQDHAYEDRPLPVGHGQTISQPYIVALTTQLAQVQATCRVLDVGTGSGYQAAVLAELADQVYSIEIVAELADAAALRLAELGYQRIVCVQGNGALGWPEQAPFDVIVAAASPSRIPQPLLDQLTPGGRLVLPVGDLAQDLVVVRKLDDGSTSRRAITSVRFVPMIEA